jgi:hypothetical protein
MTVKFSLKLCYYRICVCQQTEKVCADLSFYWNIAIAEGN